MTTLETRVQDFLAQQTAAYRLPGVDISLRQNHREILRCRQGYADLESRTPFTQDTLLHLYSNTKVIACTAAMQLWEQGLFRLDDPISLYFPEMGHIMVRRPDGSIVPAKRAITIQHLFTMTAGIGDGADYVDTGMQFYKETGGACPIVELPRFLARVPLRFHPGEGFCYGICHEILAALIVQLTGMDFGEYLQRHIFDPLDMKHTGFNPARCAGGIVATQYSYQGPGKPLKNVGTENVLVPPVLAESASGGLLSTVDDYMKFQEALCQENVLLKKETTDLMRRNHLAAEALDGYGGMVGTGYGLGVRAVRIPGDPLAVAPYGWGGAAGTYGLIDPERKLTVFYAQQVFNTRDIQLTYELERLIYDAL